MRTQSLRASGPAVVAFSTKRLAASLMVLALAGCAAVPPDGGYSDLATQSRAFVGAAPAHPRDPATAGKVAAILAQPLTPESVMRLSLLTSPRVQGAVEKLGVARADFAAAVLPPGLSLDAQVLRPQDHTSDWLEYGVGLRLFDLLALPRRAAIGKAEFEAAQAEASATVIATALDARSALVDYIAAQQLQDYAAKAQESARAAAAASGALFDAGNIPRLQRDRDRLYAAETKAARFDADAAVPQARERLNALLGLTGEQAADWTAAAALPAPPDLELNPKTAEATVVATNPGLLAANARLRVAAKRSGLAAPASILGDLEVGGKAQREEGVWTRGGDLSLDFPLFDLGGSYRDKAKADLYVAVQERRAVEAEVRAEARSQVQRVEILRQAALFKRDTVIPLTGDVYDGVVLDFNAMQTSVFQLLEAQRDRLAAGHDYIETLRDYWNARAALDALGAFQVAPSAGS